MGLEDIGYWFVSCVVCGYSEVLHCDQDIDKEQAENIAKARGWKQGKDGMFRCPKC